jgi:hypothetical protein
MLPYMLPAVNSVNVSLAIALGRWIPSSESEPSVVANDLMIPLSLGFMSLSLFPTERLPVVNPTA